jgi:hypothetical protein
MRSRNGQNKNIVVKRFHRSGKSGLLLAPVDEVIAPMRAA